MCNFSKSRRHSGFTIVELLVVIVVIGILAAITIVAYNGIQNRARGATVSSDLSNAKQQLLLDQVDTGKFPDTLAQANSNQGLQSSPGTTYQYSVNNQASPATFCITATNGTISYKITESSAPVAGGCPGHGVGGVAAVTNMIPNPSVETDSSSLGGANSTVARDTSWSSNGVASISVTPTSTTTADSFISVAGDNYGMRLGMQAGKTYTLSATLHLTSALTGTLDSRALSIVAYQNSGGYTYTSTQAPNSPGTYPLKLTFTLASNATEAFIRLYNGGYSGSGTVYYDSIMLTEGSTAYTYADGNTPNWIWNGTPNNSTSTGPPQ